MKILYTVAVVELTRYVTVEGQTAAASGEDAPVPLPGHTSRDRWIHATRA